TPTHSYMKYLYKYPQRPFPYADLVNTNRKRGRAELEYELIDTGAFDGDRYFDVFVEYAKASPEDLLVRISVRNRGPEPAAIHVLPTLWFRNEWSWHSGSERPALRQVAGTPSRAVVQAVHPALGERHLYCEGNAPLLFTENETNTQRIFGVPNRSPYVKDGIDNHVVHGRGGVVNPAQAGTKVAAHYRMTVNPGECREVRLRLSDAAPAALARADGADGSPFGAGFDAVMDARRREA